MEVCGELGGGADVFDFVHEDIDAFIQTGGNTLVKHLLEAFLLLDGRIEEIITIGKLGGNHLLGVEDVNHLLDEVANIDKFEEGDERFDASGL